MKRRNLIKNLGLIPLTGFMGHLLPSKAFAGGLTDGLVRVNGPDQDAIGLGGTKFDGISRTGIYERLGVRPVVNGRGTITIIGGCRLLPEVEHAMREATLDYVELDELMDGVGKRLAELTGAEFGMVTTGATGAMIMATTGIVTGGDPDKLWQLPDLTGMKDEVIIPKYSWTAYESAVRGVGVKMITVDSREELEAALGPRTAMVLVLAGRRSMRGPLSVAEISSITKPLGVPILVDAAAEGLPVPNPHIELGADLVAYSGGKYLGGPQCAGLLIGRKDLIKAAWVTSSPHHGFGRGYKVGREEIMGMLVAVEMWMKRDHIREREIWTNRLGYIANRLNKIEGVRSTVHQPRPDQLSNPSPSLLVQWDMAKIPLEGHEVEDLLWNANPRVAVSGSGSFLPFPPNTKPNIRINTSQLKDGEEKTIADRVFEVLSDPPTLKRTVVKPAFDISGEWDLTIKFAAGISKQTFVFSQKDNDLAGTHYASYATRELKGNIQGNEILIRSSYTLNGVRLNFTFTGSVRENLKMEGDVSLSEYGEAKWSAIRREYTSANQ
ncbi:aminotransferase class V-fold PLP-dependent enzyme [Flavobacteriaceae bacterium F89]|uniref:Aminotransferase class V-fold PLP-dependent enzyme n=1 Tax=Cerina litoralis TaxID=2874477 RepID=A0AAE3EU55_9FLAO|nr:aminotransferase class V-fold PLP-dependent enzyme [Cerina litoralis]MCG2460309.1 aminotransferase class V-fold PLP-dependent enzyme [Cerina litoralis]